MIDYFLWLYGLFTIVEAMLCLWTHYRGLIIKGNIFKYGNNSWALVTACTDGIGKGLAVALAKRGFNIVQVGRNPSKLEQQSSDLNTKYGVQVLNIIKDFSDSNKNPQQFFSDIKSKTKGLDISIVINNVGTASKNLFCSNKENDILDTLSLNLFPITFLSQLFLSDLQKRPKGGLIINLSSSAAELPFKYCITYSSTKAFDFFLSNVLANEESKVDIMCVEPGSVDTPLLTKRTNSKMIIDIDTFAEWTLCQAGSATNTAGYIRHTNRMMVLKALKPVFHFIQHYKPIFE